MNWGFGGIQWLKKWGHPNPSLRAPPLFSLLLPTCKTSSRPQLTPATCPIKCLKLDSLQSTHSSCIAQGLRNKIQHKIFKSKEFIHVILSLVWQFYFLTGGILLQNELYVFVHVCGVFHHNHWGSYNAKHMLLPFAYKFCILFWQVIFCIEKPADRFYIMAHSLQKQGRFSI